MPFSIPPSCVFCLLYANVTSRHYCLRDGEKEQKKTNKKKGKIKREKGAKKKHSSIPRYGDRPTVKCLIVQASGWTKVDLFFASSRRRNETIACRIQIDAPSTL